MNTEGTAEEDPTINSTSEAEAEPVAKTIDDANISSESKNNEETTNSQTTAQLHHHHIIIETTTTTMSEWLLQASNEEYDILTSWQLGYRFTGDNFGSKWWIHLQQLGFKHVGRLYELPPTYPKTATSNDKNVI